MEFKTPDSHGEVLRGYTTKLGDKGSKILDKYKLNAHLQEECSKLISYFNDNNKRYKRMRVQAKNFRTTLIKMQEWIIFIEDPQQRENAQLNLGLIVINRHYFCIWVEKFKTFIGSHSTVNNLLNKLGCTQVSQDLDTELKHKTILGEIRQVNRNWSVRMTNGIFDDFFPPEITTKVNPSILDTATSDTDSENTSGKESDNNEMLDSDDTEDSKNEE